MSRKNVEIVRKLFEEWNAGGYTATREFFDHDVEFVRIAMTAPA
jgi:ketosteroid isomerase-like protein